MALNGVINLQESTESDLLAVFGEDVGVAFLLLGKLKHSLKHKEDATKCFRAALRHNPFLWTAYEVLCNMGEEVCPEEVFKVSEYPKFLRSSCGQVLTTAASQPKIESVKTKGTSSATAKHDTNPESASSMHLVDDIRHISPFEPDVKNKSAFVTPELFHEPPVGNALASSTPALARNYPMRNQLPLTLGGLSTEGLRGGLEAGPGRSLLRTVRGALDFGSTGKDNVSPNMVTPLGSLAGPITPLNPRLGKVVRVTIYYYKCSLKEKYSPGKGLSGDLFVQDPTSSELQRFITPPLN